MKNNIKHLKTFLILWSTQSLSQLGSAMTGFALTLWLYEKTGSALQTALLAVCSYAPYVVMSIFAGALSDRWDKKKVMLVCDTLAACCSVAVLVLLKADLLRPVHMYLLNAVTGLMNTVQQPASDVAMTMITPKEYYQKSSGLRSLSSSLVTILNPVFATALYAFAGMDIVIYVDLTTFVIAFLALLFGVKLSAPEKVDESEKDSFLETVRAGLVCLRENELVLVLILFLAGVNFVASAFDAVLPALILPRENGGEAVLGMVTSCAGIAMLIGSLIVTALPAPKNRIRVIYLTMLFSLGTENFLLAFTRIPALWCAGQIIGWILVPVMSANLDVIVRTTISLDMQGRVYSCRNTLQFFTIPIGLFLGGLMVDQVCEPVMAAVSAQSMPARLFGTGKGSGAAMMMFILGILGIVICLGFGRVLRKYHYTEM
ncbi:MAG: MFS transporter [Lachnospiraceae bacterium]|nr:MFS transporter [Lachnospiraceae bacterium]